MILAAQCYSGMNLFAAFVTPVVIGAVWLGLMRIDDWLKG